MYLKIGVIGAGALGTAISQCLSKNVDEILLFARKQSVCDDINTNFTNSAYYPNYQLSKRIKATKNLNDLANCYIIFLTVPSSAYHSVLSELKNIVNDEVIIVTTAKGIEYPSLKTMGELIEEYFDENYVVMSGPNFANEIFLNQPTVTNVSSRSKDNSIIIKEVLSQENFKVNIIEDILGIEWCGVLKNVNAIANGICEGMDINENARYAILTNGFRESMDIIESIGGKSGTLLEYCGFGDLIMTTVSNMSRNHTLGVVYGQKLIIDDIASGIVFEGKNSIKAIKNICDDNKIQCNIVNFVYDVIIENMLPTLAFNKLWKKIE